MTKYVLETERLRLREFRDSDVDDIREMLADDHARRVFRHVVSLPEFPQGWVDRNRKRYRDDGHGLWAMETRQDGIFVGDCGVTRQQVGELRFLEVGYHLTLAARGHGYATEAARACLAYAFEKLDADRVYSIVAVNNDPSHRVAGRIHAHRETGFEKGGEAIDLYSTTREQFEQR